MIMSATVPVFSAMNSFIRTWIWSNTSLAAWRRASSYGVEFCRDVPAPMAVSLLKTDASASSSTFLAACDSATSCRHFSSSFIGALLAK